MDAYAKNFKILGDTNFHVFGHPTNPLCDLSKDC